MLTKEQQEKMLDEASVFAQMVPHDKLSFAFVAMTGLYMTELRASVNVEQVKRMRQSLATVLAPFPVEVAELLTSVAVDQEVNVNEL